MVIIFDQGLCHLKFIYNDNNNNNNLKFFICVAFKGSADLANKKKGEKKEWCIPFSRIHGISNEECSNTTCAWRARIDNRKLDSHAKKISCSSFINKVKWVIWRIQGVVHLSRTTHINQVYLENPLTLLKDELCHGDIKTA